MVSLIGLTAQLFFSARILSLWIISERSKKVVSPSIFWILSITGSYLFFIYGWLRSDFAIMLGQVISYYIYIWNLNEKGLWEKLNVVFRALLVLTPPAAIGFVIGDLHEFAETFFENKYIPHWLVFFGCAGQLLFTLRFVYQWIVSSKRGESVLPAGFWILSLVGSAMIVSYAVIRNDMVLMLGQSVGFVAYFRNIVLLKKNGGKN
ncbi:MAG: lipid-A-disaccharide synthase N-terminal domain-containing protein [Rikenellaceae bacterium]|nr:lipid-A-disaccharide synthase N-terminal domain-containing protein [Rikenellaceae bacterium]